ncbi:MAG: hypothetical protein U1E78_08830 [Gammaproteobacteria bacterium]
MATGNEKLNSRKNDKGASIESKKGERSSLRIQEIAQKKENSSNKGSTVHKKRDSVGSTANTLRMRTLKKETHDPSFIPLVPEDRPDFGDELFSVEPTSTELPNPLYPNLSPLHSSDSGSDSKDEPLFDSEDERLFDQEVRKIQLKPLPSSVSEDERRLAEEARKAEKAAPEKAAAEKAAPEKAAAEKAAPEKAAAKKAAPEKAAPEKAAPEKAAPEKAAPEKAAPEKAAPEKAAAEKAAPEKAAPEKAAPEKAAPEKAAPEKAAAEKAAPEKAAAEKAAPEKAAPEKAAPEKAAAEKAAPEKAAPEKAAAEKAAADKVAADKPAAKKPAPGLLKRTINGIAGFPMATLRGLKRGVVASAKFVGKVTLATLKFTLKVATHPATLTGLAVAAGMFAASAAPLLIAKWAIGVTVGSFAFGKARERLAKRVFERMQNRQPTTKQPNPVRIVTRKNKGKSAPTTFVLENDRDAAFAPYFSEGKNIERSWLEYTKSLTWLKTYLPGDKGLVLQAGRHAAKLEDQAAAARAKTAAKPH